MRGEKGATELSSARQSRNQDGLSMLCCLRGEQVIHEGHAHPFGCKLGAGSLLENDTCNTFRYMLAQITVCWPFWLGARYGVHFSLFDSRILNVRSLDCAR
jgi:hypothetical protein